jgi:hypothetical protein
MKRNRLLKVLKVAAIATIGIAVGGTVVTQLWNWLTPALFGWHTITFWQALGLLVLCRIFFGGFRGRGGFGGGRMMARWEKMTPEQREQFRQGMRGGRCGKFEGPTGAEPQAS